jgi:intein-encoded DNA endonuclease-like protein
MNENKKEYEIGYVDITTEEYKDIITEMVENRKDAEFERHLRWKAEAELKSVKSELEEVKAKLNEVKLALEEKNAELRFALERIAKLEEVANNG